MKGAVAGLVLTVTLPFAAWGYDVPTHRVLGLSGARSAIGLHEVLVEDLGLPEGRLTGVANGTVQLPIEGWIEAGAAEEDRPFWRVRHHFHHPLVPWLSAGLTLDTSPRVTLGQSSIVWAQAAFQEGPQGGGTWTWPFARQRYVAALTGRTSSERQVAFADTFRALGHVTHFIQDATVPAHVRNDMHLWLPLGNERFYPINSDWYEDWVEQERSADSQRFRNILALPPKRPLRLVLHSEHPEAPIPIAGLIDTDRVAMDGPMPALLGPHEFGIAELTHPNFLSRDTIFAFQLRPSLLDLGDPFVQARQDGTFRRYAPKVTRGTPTVEVIHFVAEAALAHSLAAVQPAPPPGVLWILDDLVHEDYARHLLPRAVGYSAELLDYFFRGRLALEMVTDPFDPSVVRLVGTNGSPEPLFEGSLTLHADRPGGDRAPATPLEPTSVIGVAPGEPLISARFRLPDDAERLVAVYEGTLGLERKREDFRGAVIGKVFGGVRVEEVFADGDRWRLRTPVGVFDLPLSTDVYDDVKWGDTENLLVARTALTAEPPAFAATFEIVRRPRSIEPLLSGTAPVVTLEARGFASLSFASAPLVTTIALDQTVQYRQRIGRWRQELATEWTTPVNSYQTVSVTRTPVTFETLHEQTVRFADTIPIRLDPEHNLDVGDSDVPYFWDLVDVFADRDGRLLGLAAVFLTRPDTAPVSVPWLRLDGGGQPFAARTLEFEARFPDDATMIWALVDLGSGAVVASTAEATITLTSRLAAEGPPWSSGGAGHTLSPGVYRHAVITYAGGPLAGHVDSVWEPIDLVPRASPDGLVTTLDVATGDDVLAVTGWFQPEIRAALHSAGLGDFTAEVQRSILRWNYVCLTSPCTADSDHAGFAVDLRRGGITRPPAQLIEARRARPAPAGERLVLLGSAFRDAPRPIGSVVTWDARARRAHEALRLPPSFHGLGPQASTGAALVSFRPQMESAGTFLVPLDAGGIARFFEDQDLEFDFTVLPPDRLYSIRDFRFYGGEPPLHATPLPARLRAVPGDPAGDYHVVRVP